MTLTTKELISERYIDFLLRNGKQPVSVYVFAADNGMSEANFYEHYPSFEAIENSVLTMLFEKTLERLLANETYQQYSIRERLLAFYFTLIEELQGNRSFVKHLLSEWKNPLSIPGSMKGAKATFDKYAQELIAQGYESGEILQRPVISDKYANGLWMQLLFVVRFWLVDSSQSFERTDAAIEKAVNLSMDLMAHNTFDKAFDFAKFLAGKA